MSSHKFSLRIGLASALLVIASCKSPGGPDVGASSLTATSNTQTSSYTLVGYVPSKYVANSNSGYSYRLAAITVKKEKIESVKAITASAISSLRGKVLVLRNSDNNFDFIYPGLADLHNHTKQNALPLWGEAVGQFANRFEWRAWNTYTKSVSYNMNPWVNSDGTTGIPACASFRWSELQALTLGTTYLQGPSTNSCVEDYAVARVENLGKIAAPTDLVVPGDVTFVWKHIRPLVNAGMSYPDAMYKKIQEICPRLITAQNLKDASSKESLKILKNKKLLTEHCNGDPDKFIRYTYWAHSGIMGKINHFKEGGSLIAHLSEGRRNDPYNNIEFDFVRIFGLDQPGANFVHGVGIRPDDLAHMAKKGMGLVWSPFSNLLLYGETLDLRKAYEVGLKKRIAIGSDWTPTGSKSILEEFKIARDYIQKERLTDLIDDEELVNMATENAARILNLEGVFGTIARGAHASFVVISGNDNNVYSNLINADAKDVNLVVVKGKVQYGDPAYIQQFTTEFETLPNYQIGLNSLSPSSLGKPVSGTKEEKRAHLLKIMAHPAVKSAEAVSNCGFKKAFVHQNTDYDKGQLFEQELKAAGTEVDFDRVATLQRILGAHLVTQSYNRNPDAGKGDADFRVKFFPPLFSCHDSGYSKRLKDFVTVEYDKNRRNRRSVRARQSLGSTPARMAEKFELNYDANRDY